MKQSPIPTHVKIVNENGQPSQILVRFFQDMKDNIRDLNKEIKALEERVEILEEAE